MSLLHVSDLTVSFGPRAVVDTVSFDIARGERVALIGESGSGKSMTALAIDGLLPEGARVSGSVLLDDDELVGAPESAMLGVRGNRIGMVFQEPQTSLNPVIRVKHQLVTALRNHRGLKRAEINETARRLARSVELSEDVVERYPHELSGGQRQRVVIAMATSTSPDLLIADEPTTALDATVQAKVLDLMMARVDTEGAALLLITHDMAVAARVAERILVMHNGRIVEQGATMDILRAPAEPYTAELIAAARATSLH